MCEISQTIILWVGKVGWLFESENQPWGSWAKDSSWATWPVTDHLYCTKLQNSALYWTELHCTALHCTVLHCTSLHCIVRPCITLHCTALRGTALHCNAPHCTTPWGTTLHCTTLHCTTLHCTALHCIALHCTALHYIREKAARREESDQASRHLPRAARAQRKLLNKQGHSALQCTVMHCTAMYCIAL